MKSTAKNDQAPQFVGGFELFKPSIDIIKLNFKTFLTLLIVPILFLVPGYIFNEMAKNNTDHAVPALLLTLVGMLALVLVNPALVYTQLKGARKEVVEPGIAFKTGLTYFWRVLWATVLQTLIFILAIIALVVPFFFAYRRYMLVPYYIVARDMRVMEAFKRSAEDSITYKGPMWGIVGVSFLAQLASIIPLVGWIPSLLYGCAPAVRYTEVTDASESAPKEETPQESLKAVLK